MSDGGDERQRPQYGEYATPEEQRSRIQHPDSSSAPQQPAAPLPPVQPPTLWGASPQPSAPRDPGTPPPNQADRIATIALLAFGAFNVVSSVFSFFNLSAAMQQVFQIMGVEGEFTNEAAARVWGPVAAGILVIGFLITIVLALRRLRAGRITWWLPLVGAVITYVFVYVCIAVPLFGDPAFTAYVTSR